MRVAAKFNVNREKALFGEPDHPELCERIAARIPEELLRHGRILDCSIGCGGIARAVVNRMVNELYIDHYDAIMRVYGVDTNQAFVNRARRLGFVNTVCTDFLTWQPDMQFDVVIGNPPYQKSKYSDFYVCFIRRSAELLREGGYFSMIAPAKGAQPLSRAQKPLLDVGWNRVEFGIESYFPNIGTVIANYIGTKGELAEKLQVVVEGEEIEVKRGTVFPLFAQNAIVYSIVQKFFSFEQKLPFTRKVVPVGDYIYVSRLIGTWSPKKDKGGPYALRAFVNDAPEQNDGGFVMATNAEEAEHFKWVITRSLIVRFITNHCVRATFVPPMFWELMPNILDCATDDAILKKLKFTKAEITYLKSWETASY